jgi:hypothetical protein
MPIQPTLYKKARANQLKIGTEVVYHPLINDDYQIHFTTIRSEVWQLPHGTKVVKVEGKAGGMALEAIELLSNYKSRTEN